MEKNLSEAQINLIAHSLGVNYYNAKVSKNKKYKVLPSEFYRNYFCYVEFDSDMKGLKDMGFIELWEQYNNNYFGVTEAGIEAFRTIFKAEIIDKYQPLSKKSQQRYQDWIDADTGWSYADFIGIEQPRREYDSDYNVRLVNPKNSNIKGEYKRFLKDAKVSYKVALKASKLS